MGGILGFGIGVIILALFEILPQSFANAFGSCIDMMNNIVGWVAQQENFVISNISFSWRMLVLFYWVIISSVILIKKHEKHKIYLVLIPLTLLFLTGFFEKHLAASHNELIIFQNPGNTVIGVLENQNVQLYYRDSITEKTKHFLLGNYTTQRRAKIHTSSLPLKNVYQYKKQVIMVVDSMGIYQLKRIKPDMILLSNSPKIHLDRLLDSLAPKQIIADGSNYRSYLDRWEASCEKRKIPFHRTDKKGAFILK
ncbi:hypothetical protein GCM10022258_31330 [Aquimarina gracilis]